MPISRHLLRPVTARLILACFIAAMLANLLPWGLLSRAFSPDFVLLMLLYWTLNQPRRIGVGTGFMLGLLMDVANGAMLGQHALAYSVVCYLVLMRHRQLNLYPYWQQAIGALGLMLLAQIIMTAVRILGGADWPAWPYYLSTLLPAFCWVPMSNLLLIHQRKLRSEAL
ncbi:rod shape-determining protein MreD [Chitinibacteraceae bacterium HSL-7]